MRGHTAPKTVPQRIVFTCIGVLLMATTMAIYNKYLVYGSFSVELFKQVGIAFCQKAPVAFILQFFFVQKFAGKQAAKYPTENRIVYQCIRTGFTVLIMCPIMCLYSNIINMIQFHWTVGKLMEAWISKMPINWVFAFGVQIWFLGPINRFLFGKIFAKQKSAAQSGKLS